MRRIGIIMAICGWLIPQCLGQPSNESPRTAFTAEVHGSGVATLNRPAERMRAMIGLTARGVDVRSAGLSLQKKLDTARQHLAGLGAVAESFRATPAAVVTGQSEMHRRMRLMISQNAVPSGGAFGGAADGVRPVVSLRTIVLVDFPLRGETDIDRLALSHELQSAIQEAQLNGASEETSDLSPEEQEVLEEASMMSDSGEEDPNKPRYTFIGTVTQEERTTLLSQAFERARASATELAAAAGTKLGAIAAVSTGEMEEDAMHYIQEDDDYSASAVMMRALGHQAAPQENITLMAFSSDPAVITYAVRISASFQLSP